MLVAYLFLFLTIFAVGSQGAYIANGRIVGGTPVEIEEAPYHVLVRASKWGKRYTCGGSIIARNVILTAGHCIKGTSDIKVRVGTKHFNKGGTEYNSSNHKVHEDNVGEKNDIALVWLSEKLEYSKTVARIELPLSTDVIEDGTMTTITGWGKTQEGIGGAGSKILLKAEVPIVNQEVCKKAYASKNYTVTDDMICAGLMGVGGKDSCQGDSGGPMVANGKQWGIVSWGEGCARPKYPGVYTRVTYFREWINKNVEFD